MYRLPLYLAVILVLWAYKIEPKVTKAKDGKLLNIRIVIMYLLTKQIYS